MFKTLHFLPAVLALVTASGFANCPGGLPPPCVRLAPLKPSLTPSIDIEKWALPPQVRSFQLQSPPPIAAPAQLAIVAPPSADERVGRLRQRAALLIDQIRFKGYEVSFQGLTTLLSPAPPYSPSAETAMNEARQLVREYLVVLREIEWITLGVAIGGQRYDERVAQLRIVQGPTGAVDFDLDPLYSVHQRNATVHVEHPAPVSAGRCRRETVYETKIVDITVDAGFDSRGNPIKRQGRDIVQRPREVVVCD